MNTSGIDNVVLANDVESLMKKAEKKEETQVNEYGIDMKKYRYSHMAWAQGYMSRREGFVVEEYKGRYGKGYKVHTPSWESTQYHHIEYYVAR